jgi:hypothetical protein
MQLSRTLKALAVGLGAYVALAAVAADSARTHVGGALPSPVSVALADTSGTRLKASYTVGSDGSKLFDADAVYDSQLGVDCSFSIAADGQTRCPGIQDANLQKPIVFSDAACTTPVVV